MTKFLMTFVAAAIVATSPCLAEPTPAVQSLMNQPASMFSFGIYRLREIVNQRFQNQAYLAPLDGSFVGIRTVLYDWDRNRIIFSLTDSTFVGIEDEEQRCKQLVRFVRAISGVSPETGVPISDSGISFYASYFAHIGYSNDANFEAIKEIDNLFEIRYAIQNMNTLQIEFECSAPLLGTGYNVAKS